jgi:hypothetical protein
MMPNRKDTDEGLDFIDVLTSALEGDFMSMDRVRVQRAAAEAAGTTSDRVFDWDKAAEIIKERQPEWAAAGLIEDWGYTGGTIYSDGAPESPDDTYTYLASNWATPTLVINDSEEIECWVPMTEDGWNEHTYWPDSALKILGVPMPEADDEEE